MPGLTVTDGNGSVSSRKRSRQNASNDDSDGDIIDVQEASSSFRRQEQPQRKRARVSGTVTQAGPSRYSPSSDAADSSDDDVEVQDSRMAVDSDDESDALPQSVYEEMRDSGFEHLQFEKEDDIRATQFIQSRAEVVGENRVAENGILESIECINFMCHTRLYCPLGPLLNFIVGENGSGKSAILTAITLCLGGKASSTNRGGSLKTFVKEGTEKAVLRVKIKNQGLDAYQPDTYGDSITVERSFTRGGSSGFQLKSANDRIISKKKEDVNQIVEYYCLQVDNPLNVLSQDNARQFLNASSAKLKYKYFIQGVQLEQLDKDYALVKEYVDATEGKIPDQEERVRETKLALEAAQWLQQAIKQNEELRSKSTLYTHQLAWIQVQEQEAKLEEYESRIKQTQQGIEQYAEDCQKAADELDVIDAKIQGEDERLQPLKVADSEAEVRVTEVAEEIDVLRKQHQGLLASERDIRSHINAQTSSVQSLEAQIREEAQRLEDRNGQVVKETQERLETAKREVDGLKKSIADGTPRLPALLREQENVSNEFTVAGKDLDAKRHDISSVQSKIDDLRQGSGSLYAPYEANVPRLLKMIVEDGGFAEKPIGPLGSLVQITKPVWSGIIEKTFGQNLNAFLVTSKKDQQRLQGMMQRLNIYRCPIFIGNSAPLNTNGREPAEEFDTILRVLKFDNDRVRNQLIITGGIEQIILVQDRKEAQDIMHRGAPPNNVKACLCQHDGKRGYGLRLTNTGGNIATSPVSPFEGRPRMQANVDEQIAVHQVLLDQHSADLRACEAKKRLLLQQKQQCDTAIKTNKREMEQFRTSLRLAETAVSTIEGELDQFDGADGRLKNLQEQLEERQKTAESYGAQFGEMKVHMEEKKEAIAKLKADLRDRKTEKAEFEAKIKKLETKLKTQSDLRRIALSKKNNVIQDRELLKIKLGKDEEKYVAQKDYIEDFIKQAEEVSRRVDIPEGETAASIEKKFDAVEKQLKNRQARMGMSDQQINEKVIHTKTAYDLSKATHEISMAQILTIKQSLMGRLEKWRIFQRYISASSRTNFIYLLSERGFRGSLKIDHQNKKLQVTVEPDETKEKGAARNTKTLSGGEKSFTSICLLLAIWEAMGSPLRCLDEFDVFMDNVNRAISTNMLITAARRSVGRQYILITPNSIEGQAVKDKDVKIIRLTDPRQRTLV